MLTNNDSPSTSQASAEEGISKPVPSFQRSTSNLTPSTTSTPPSLQRHPQSNLESSTVDTLLSDTLSRLDLSANVIISPRPSESSVPTALFKKPNVDPAHAEESDAVIRTGRSTQINRRRSCSDDSTSESESESEQSKDDASTSSSATSVSSVESSSKTAAIPAISARLSTRTISHIVHSILIPLRKKPTLRDFLPILQEEDNQGSRDKHLRPRPALPSSKLGIEMMRASSHDSITLPADVTSPNSTLDGIPPRSHPHDSPVSPRARLSRVDTPSIDSLILSPPIQVNPRPGDPVAPAARTPPDSLSLSGSVTEADDTEAEQPRSATLDKDRTPRPDKVQDIGMSNEPTPRPKSRVEYNGSTPGRGRGK